ncbi:MAG: uroporphyrinogen-III synthase [Proteobacteria bacterium]|nr:uroporphyrinogen-III synthase [Pseudomonadota bacterium]MBI3497069.1 uroporphyrinogen-III synthase [Pseudomonadota bacterium]
MRALITRPREDAQLLAPALLEIGVEAMIEPLLEVVPRPDAVISLAGVAGLIFTSANGARAFARLRSERALTAFAVGDATAEALGDAGFAAVISADGDVGDLAALIRRRFDPRKGALLHVAGSAVAGDLAGTLGEAGFVVRRVILYEAKPATRLSQQAIDALERGLIDLVLIFSPRTGATFASLVKAHNLARAVERTTLAALSRRVAEASAALPWRQIRIAAAPTTASLMALVEDLAGASPDGEPAPRQAMSEPAPANQPPQPAPASLAAAAPALRPRPSLAAAMVAGLVTALAVLVVFVGLLWLARDSWRADPQRLFAGAPPATAGADASSTSPRLDQIERGLAAATETVAAADQRLDALAGELKLVRELLAQPNLDVHPPTVDLKPLEDRTERLEAALAAVDRLAQRLRLIESQPKPPMVDPAEIARLQQAQRELADRLAREEATPKPNPADAQLLAELEKGERGLAERLIKLETAMAAERAASGRAAALLLAVVQLKAALAGSGGFAPELKAVRALAGEDGEITQAAGALEPRQQKGVASLEMLRQRFEDAAAAAIRAEIAGPDQGVIGEALNRVASLVSIRRRNATDGLQGKLARAEKALEGGDLDGALLAQDGIQGPPGDALKAWIADARTRLAADRAIERMLTRATQLLGQRPAP